MNADEAKALSDHLLEAGRLMAEGHKNFEELSRLHRDWLDKTEDFTRGLASKLSCKPFFKDILESVEHLKKLVPPNTDRSGGAIGQGTWSVYAEQLSKELEDAKGMLDLVDAEAREVGYTDEVNCPPWTWMRGEIDKLKDFQLAKEKTVEGLKKELKEEKRLRRRCGDDQLRIRNERNRATAQVIEEEQRAAEVEEDLRREVLKAREERDEARADAMCASEGHGREYDRCAQLVEQNTALRAEVERLRVENERLTTLRDVLEHPRTGLLACDCTLPSGHEHQWVVELVSPRLVLAEESLDAVIDAARAALAAKGEEGDEA